MVTRAVILLAVVAVASSASFGKHMRCCGPTKWQATASLDSMSGRLSVDHDNKLAMLYLMSESNITNTTMVIAANDSSLYVYFIVQNQAQPQCTAYVFENIIPDLSGSCFPAQQSSILDKLKSQLPTNLLAYEFAGLKGLFVVQMAAKADDCSPSMFSLSTGASDGPRLNVVLSGLQSMISDQSGSSMVQDACSNVIPINIMVPNNGIFENRRGSMDSVRSSNDDSSPQQWIADVVTMYIVQMMGSRVSLKSNRSWKDVLAPHDKDSRPSPTDILQNATALKYLMQNVSDFLHQIVDNDTTNGNNSDKLRDHMDDAIAWLITRDLITSLMSRMNPDDGRDDSRDDDDDDVIDVITWIVKRNLISRLMSDNRRDKNDHHNDDVDALVALMIKKKLISSIMSDHEKDGEHHGRDDRDDDSRDGRRGDDNNDRRRNDRDDDNRDDDDNNDDNDDDIISWLIKKMKSGKKSDDSRDDDSRRSRGRRDDERDDDDDDSRDDDRDDDNNDHRRNDRDDDNRDDDDNNDNNSHGGRKRTFDKSDFLKLMLLMGQKK